MLLLTLVKGLEGVVEGELRQKLADFKIVKQGAGSIVIKYHGHPRRLLDLRSVEDVFYLLFSKEGFERSRSTLTEIKEIIQSHSFDDALKYHAQLHSKPKHTNFQVFAHLYGRWNFRRADLEQEVSKAIDQKFRRWKPVRGRAKLEFDVRLTKEGEVMLSLRLTDKFFSNRKYKVADIPGSLKPTVAYAMVYMSKPKAADVFADPFCGAGTILVERSLAAAAEEIIGSDQSEQSLAAARQNIVGRKNIKLQEGEATKLPFDDQSVSTIATNPPFGKKIAKEDDLFSGFLVEAVRVLKPEGHLVVLNSDTIGFEKALAKYPEQLSIQKQKDIMLLGEPSRIWVIIKQK